MREMKRFVLVNSAVGSVAKDAAVHGYAREIVGPHGSNQRLIERLVSPLIVLPNVDPHHLCMAFDFEMFRRYGLLWFRDLCRFGNGSFLELDHAGACHLLKLPEQLVD